MVVLCLFGFHSPGATIHANRGLAFSTCRGCGRDLVRTGRSWRQIPRGFRLVWRATHGRDDPDRRHRSLVVRRPSRIGFLRPEGLLGMFGIAVQVLLASARRGWSVAAPPSGALPNGSRRRLAH